MKDTKPNLPQNEVWQRVAYILLGIAIPIIVTRLFEDGFYVALGITVAVLIGLFLTSVPLLRWKIIYSGVTLAVAVILVILYLTNASPKFEVNPIGLSTENNGGYYVTDPIIRTQGDLGAYKTFTLSPLAVEVVPRYSGDNKYGNLVLRVSGNTSTKDIPLWTNFDRSSQAQTVHIALADILAVSGISENRNETDSNLMLGDKPYQTASLSLAVIRLSAPNNPFGVSKEILLKNTPWRQATSITQRNGWVIDYALTNLGVDATFHCRITVVRTLSDVTESDLSFWSGTDDKSTRYLTCPSFTLKTGKTYTASFPLNNETLGGDIIHGRYLVQVYTFAERNDIIFNNSSYEGSNDMWVVSNTGSIGTFVVCGDPGKTCEQTDTLPIEEKTIKAFPFSSNYELGNGYTYFATRTYPVNNRSTNQYILDYSIDPQKEGWVGFGVWFEDTIDVSEFNSIRFKLILDQSKHPISLDVKYKVDDVYKTSRAELGSGTYGTPSSEEQTIIVPFNAFEGVDWTKVDTLNFMIDSYRVPDTIQHEIQISEIEFIH